MLTFDTRGFARFLRGWLVELPWTPRRALVTAAFVLLFPPLVLVTWLALWLDEVAFPGYRRRRVEAPVFIVGNFRSGTTFLHRMLAEDRRHFTTMTLWQILFAPSLVQRRLIRAAGALERRLGHPVSRLRARLERHWARRNVMHRVALDAPEEDEYLLLWIWSTLATGLSAGLLEQARPYARFDRAIPAPRRRRIMAFYHRCVQRHLHDVDRPGVCYLAKNPAASPKLASLLARFPDARVIHLVRDPLEAVPSFVSMMRFSWAAVGVPVDREAGNRFIMETAGHWYRCVPQALDGLPGNRRVTVCYHRLARDPEGTVRGLYRRLGLPVPPELAAVLRAEADAARRRVSEHRYTPESLALDRAALARLRDAAGTPGGA